LSLPTRLAGVTYGIRGRLHEAAERLERSGSAVLDLSIGNPAAFGFRARAHIVEEVAARLEMAQGYTPAKGLLSAREAVAAYAAGQGIAAVTAGEVYLGNGVSELILASLQALLDEGDEVLVPMPDPCDESEAWLPDVEAMEALVTPRTKALVLINPNNPTGAVYPRATVEAIMEVARRHDLVVLSDEIYDQILYDGLRHTASASLAPDLVCLTFNGLSKAYRVAGYRSGWLAITGPKEHAAGFLEGIDLLASTRLCPNVPAQHAIQVALGGYQSIEDLILPGGRLLEQRDVAWERLNMIPGVSCVKPKGALYAFPRLDPNVYEIRDDSKLILDLLLQAKILMVQGTGFNWPNHDHLRIVTLPWARDLTVAIERFGNFLSSYRQ
jgi:alanine-synthesizing transaminase